MIGRLKDLMRLAGGEWLVTFTTRDAPGKLFDKYRDADVRIDIKKDEPARSNQANRFMWEMCTLIGKSLKPPISKDEVYRMAIRAVGSYTDVTVCVWDVEEIQRRWNKGDGWFIDVIDDAGVGKKELHLYYGTSTYTVSEMRVLLDWLVDQCEQMEIPLRMSKEEEERALAQWEKASSKRKMTEPASCAAG
jgi:hypothetical protein